MSPSLDVNPKNLKKVLEATHPLYDSNVRYWKMYEECYCGGPTIAKWIHQHMRESKTSVDQRRARYFYPNYCQTILDQYMAYVFRKGVVRQAVRKDTEVGSQAVVQQAYDNEQYQMAVAQQQGNGPPLEKPAPGPGVQVADPQAEASKRLSASKIKKKRKSSTEDELEEFWRDSDRLGSSIDTIMTEVGIWMMVYGQYHVIVDMPVVKKEIKNELERKQQGLRPYLTLVNPICLTNWEYDRYGDLLWIRIKQDTSSEISPFIERPKKTIYEYHTWTRDSWYVHRCEGDKVEETDKGDHELEEVPLVSFYQAQKVHLAPISHSFLRDIGPLNLAVLNWGSLIDNEAYERCLNILVMECSQMTPAEIVIGTNNVLQYEKGGTPPHFLAASTVPAAFIQTMIREAVQEIYRLSRLGGLTGRVVREARSGVAYKFESQELNQALASKADKLEVGERRLHELHEKWLGREWQGVIDYPEEFGIESVEEEVQLLTQVKQQLRSPTLKRLLEKKSASKLLGKVPKSVLSTVEEEIDLLEEVKPTGGFFGGF